MTGRMRLTGWGCNGHRGPEGLVWSCNRETFLRAILLWKSFGKKFSSSRDFPAERRWKPDRQLPDFFLRAGRNLGPKSQRRFCWSRCWWRTLEKHLYLFSRQQWKTRRRALALKVLILFKYIWPQSYEQFTSLYSHKLGNTSLFKVACTHYFSQSHTANACLIKYFEFKRKDQSEWIDFGNTSGLYCIHKQPFIGLTSAWILE